jgi:hypothetical protein
MKKIILVGLMAFTSSMAFADIQVFENENRREADRFSCHFRQGKGDLRCRLKAKFDDNHRSPNSAAVEDDRDRDRSLLALECSDGFEMLDRHARSKSDHKDLILVGRDNGSKATLRILDARKKGHDNSITDDRENDRDDDELRAILRIDNDGSITKLRGRCEANDRDHDDDAVL